MPGVFASGEAVGGANGANRLSGNAIPEALVFGERAGRFGASPPGAWRDGAARDEEAPASQSVSDVRLVFFSESDARVFLRNHDFG